MKELGAEKEEVGGWANDRVLTYTGGANTKGQDHAITGRLRLAF